MNVFDLYVFELLKFAVRSSRESQLNNIKSVFIHKNSLVFTRSVSSNMFYIRAWAHSGRSWVVGRLVKIG